MSQLICTKCLICQGETVSKPATIAPFLVSRCGLDVSTTSIRYCKICDFAFFERRLSHEEAGRLYTGYRGTEYNAARIAIEPGYEPLIDFMANQYGEYYLKRIQDYNSIFDLFPEIRPKSVLDFGGDGQIAARVFPSAEVSFEDANAGATIYREKFDLIFASQVFEHLSDIKTHLIEIAGKMEDDGVLFIDVPKEYEGSLAEGLFVQERNWGALFYMHEHINHFSPRGLASLVQVAGLVPFFEVLPISYRTIALLAAKPEAKLIAELQQVSVGRKLQWTANSCLRIAAEQRG